MESTELEIQCIFDNNSPRMNGRLIINCCTMSCSAVFLDVEDYFTLYAFRNTTEVYYTVFLKLKMLNQ